MQGRPIIGFGGRSGDVSLGKDRSQLVARIGKRWALIFLCLMLTFFSITGHGFFSVENFQNIMLTACIIVLLGAGETFVIITGGIDLSTGYVMGMTSVCAAMTMNSLAAHGWPGAGAVIVGCLAAMFFGLLAGTVNGFLVARLNVPPFIATLGMYSVAYGSGLLASGGMPIVQLPEAAGQFGNGYLFYFLHGQWSFLTPVPTDKFEDLRDMVGVIPLPIIAVALVLMIFWLVLAKTRFGIHTYAIGGSADAAIRSGINTKRHLMMIYMISSFFAALGGAFFALKYTTGVTDAGSLRMMDAIAAVVIGGASLFGGTGTILGTIIGSLIIATLETGLIILGLEAFWQYVAVGSIIVLAILVDQLFPELVHKEE